MRDYKLDGCFVDDEKKFALIHIYKNASISMRNALNMRGKYYKWDDIKNLSVKTICVIRNPLERVVSSYQYLLRLEGNGFINKHPIHITKETEFFKEKDNPIESFNLFLNYIDNDNFYDAVTLPQVQFLIDRSLTIDDIDEVLIQENIEEDFKKFKEKYNLNTILNVDNRGNSNITKMLLKHIEDNEKIKEKIKKIYKHDFELYNKLNTI
jgi:hypothetical protein